MAVLAVLSYRHVKQQLYRQSENRLEQANRALAQPCLNACCCWTAHSRASPQAILQLAAAKRLPRIAAPRRRRPKLRKDPGRLPDGQWPWVESFSTAPGHPGETAAADLIEASKALIAGLDLLARQRFVAVEFVGDDEKGMKSLANTHAVPVCRPGTVPIFGWVAAGLRGALWKAGPDLPAEAAGVEK